MRAVVVSRPGGPEVLRVVDLPTPEPGPGEVRIRTRAAAVNPTDTVFRQVGRPRRRAFRSRGSPEWSWPAPSTRPARESTGARGQRVMAVVTPRRPQGGAYAEQVVEPADGVAATPDGISDAEAATLPMNGLTVWAALRMLALSPGQVLGVTGAAGAVGGYAIELGKLAGCASSRRCPRRGPGPRAGRRCGGSAGRRRGGGLPFRSPEGVDGLLDAAVLDERALGAVRHGGALATVRF